MAKIMYKYIYINIYIYENLTGLDNTPKSWSLEKVQLQSSRLSPLKRVHHPKGEQEKQTNQLPRPRDFGGLEGRWVVWEALGFWGEGTLQQKEKTYPTKWEVRKIIKSKVAFKRGALLVPRRLFSKSCFLHPRLWCFIYKKNLGFCSASIGKGYILKESQTDSGLGQTQHTYKKQLKAKEIGLGLMPSCHLLRFPSNIALLSPPLRYQYEFSVTVHPGRLTWNLQITHWERKMIWTKPPWSCSSR